MKSLEVNNWIGVCFVCMCVCVCVCVCVFVCVRGRESALRVVTYTWAAERAGGEARGGSTNRPRPVAKSHKNTNRGRSNLWVPSCVPVTCFGKHSRKQELGG